MVRDTEERYVIERRYEVQYTDAELTYDSEIEKKESDSLTKLPSPARNFSLHLPSF